MADLELSQTDVSGAEPETVLEERKTRKAARREFLTRLGSAGLGVVAGSIIAGCGGGGGNNTSNAVAQSPSLDQQILNAAATAEALASTMYFNIINSPIYTSSLNGNTPDQAYLVAAYEQEISHYNTLVGAGASPLATTFYFPTGMFTTSGLQTTINTLSVLEDAFIAAYLYGVLAFSATQNKVLAAQIMGVEAEHRTLARVIAHDVNLTSTASFGGSTSSVVPPAAAANDLAYEHTYGVTSLSTITTALGPFLASGSSGYSTTPFPLSSAATINSNGTLSATYPSGVTAVTLSTSAPLT